MAHIPVLLKEVLEVLDPKSGQFIVDGTTDGGGHLEAIIERMEEGKILAVDWDRDILEATKERIQEKFSTKKSGVRVVWIADNYTDIPVILEATNLGHADGLLLDLGFSTQHLEARQGFSYTEKAIDEPLDMRYDRYEKNGNVRATASDVVNSLREEELADIIYKYGEERFSRYVAKRIVEAREGKSIITVRDLVAAIKKAVPKFFKKGEGDMIARTFQALRIYVNQELENVESILKSLPTIMEKGGKVAIITFHSLEDRIVKQAFKDMEKRGIAKILTKKPIAPTEEEIKGNPASRSAKLRAIEII